MPETPRFFWNGEYNLPVAQYAAQVQAQQMAAEAQRQAAAQELRQQQVFNWQLEQAREEAARRLAEETNQRYLDYARIAAQGHIDAVKAQVQAAQDAADKAQVRKMRWDLAAGGQDTSKLDDNQVMHQWGQQFKSIAQQRDRIGDEFDRRVKEYVSRYVANDPKVQSVIQKIPRLTPETAAAFANGKKTEDEMLRLIQDYGKVTGQPIQGLMEDFTKNVGQAKINAQILAAQEPTLKQLNQNFLDLDSVLKRQLPLGAVSTVYGTPEINQPIDPAVRLIMNPGARPTLERSSTPAKYQTVGQPAAQPRGASTAQVPAAASNWEDALTTASEKANAFVYGAGKGASQFSGSLPGGFISSAAALNPLTSNPLAHYFISKYLSRPIAAQGGQLATGAYERVMPDAMRQTAEENPYTSIFLGETAGQFLPQLMAGKGASMLARTTPVPPVIPSNVRGPGFIRVGAREGYGTGGSSAIPPQQSLPIDYSALFGPRAPAAPPNAAVPPPVWSLQPYSPPTVLPNDWMSQVPLE